MAEKTIQSAAESGDDVATLQVLRNRLAIDLDNTDHPPHVAALALRLTDVLAQIRELQPPTQQESVADEIAARRVARRGKRAKAASRPKGA